MSRLIDKLQEALQRQAEAFKAEHKVFAFKKLEREIIKQGACVECGSCVANCPEMALEGSYEGGIYTPTLIGKCTACGLCYANCPRTHYHRSTLLGPLLGKSLKARAKEKTLRAQDGGVVTELNRVLLEQGKIDAAVVVKSSDLNPWMPEAVVVRNPDALQQTAGSIYTHAPIVEGVIKALKEGLKKLSVVGTACNIDSVWRLENLPPRVIPNVYEGQVLKFGLFCTKSYDYEKLRAFLQTNGINIGEVTRFAITGGKLLLNWPDGEREWPVKELEGLSASGCESCYDMSGFNADLSFGNVGSDDGWTTILVKTKKGEEALLTAIESGRLEAEELEEKQFQEVDNLARFKANRKYT
ncbi:MAG: 4Fe-4S dicluster domain-containing protein [Candidatus Thorarchaeota archaeon]|nr:4Fe-4S dicluster domain-containing protein [Candidatus Thorarchaeota archaeon]